MTVTPREIMLDEAKAIVTRSRAQQYAPPDQDFTNIAHIWSVLLGVPVNPAQVAMCMVALKLCRLMHAPEHADSWTDVAGYAACGFEVTREREVEVKEDTTNPGIDPWYKDPNPYRLEQRDMSRKQ
jgi:hypothetical protein